MPDRLLLECMDKREADVLQFLTDLRVPLTSNQTERDLRPAKTQQKISGRPRFETATRNRYAIRGYASTAVKTEPTPLSRSATPSQETPRCQPSRKSPDRTQQQSRSASSRNVTRMG